MAEVANKNGLVSVVDNTFASPWSCKPVEMGFDIVLHSGTKYLGGHADLTAGFAAGKKDLIEQIFSSQGVLRWGSGSPDVLPLGEGNENPPHSHARPRIKFSGTSQATVVHEMVEKVIHSSLESHPDHAIAQKIMPNGSGMLAFVIKGGINPHSSS